MVAQAVVELQPREGGVRRGRGELLALDPGESLQVREGGGVAGRDGGEELGRPRGQRLHERALGRVAQGHVEQQGRKPEQRMAPTVPNSRLRASSPLHSSFPRKRESSQLRLHSICRR